MTPPADTANLENDAPPRPPLIELLALAIPTIAQMASYTILQFTDTFMLARLGVREPTAAGNAGIFAFSVIGFGVGVLFCVNTLVSQNFGKKDYPDCGRYLWQGVWFGLAFALLVAPFVAFSSRVFTLFGHEPELVVLESSYFRICLAATAVKMTATALGQFLLAINRPWIVLLAAFSSIFVNVGANWLLIYGHWGFPAMGVAGAAWGTNLAVTWEVLVLAAFAFGPSVRQTFNTLDWLPRLRQMKTLLSIGLSSGLQLVADVLAWGLFVVWVMGQFKTEAMAASNFMFRYLSVSFMPAFGLSTAVTALVGRYIGAGQPDVAEQRAHLGFKVSAVYMLACGALYVIFRNDLVHLFTDDPEVLRIGAVLMIFAGAYQLFDALYIIYNGALRGAGDTFVPAVATAGLNWTISVGGGYLVARTWPQWGPAGPWVVATLYGGILSTYIFLRFKRGRWKSITLESDAPTDKVRGFEALPNPAGAEPG